MFKILTGCFTTSVWLKLTLVAFILVQGQAWAAIECRFGNGYGGTSTLVNGVYSNTIRWESSGGPKTSMNSHLLATVDLTLSPSLQSTCSVGNDGEVLRNKPNYANYTGGSTEQDNAAAQYATNIAGIYYTVKIYSDAGGGYFGGANSESDGWYITEPDHNDERWKNKVWKAQIHIWQNDYEFNGNPSGITMLTPKGSYTLGQMAIGDYNDSNNKPWTFNVTPSTFQIPIIASTCQTTQLSTGSTNIDLGEYMISDFNASPRTTTFMVQLLGCNNVWAVDFKMTTNKTTGAQNQLLANTIIGGATGVGVLLHSDLKGQDIMPNGISYTWHNIDTGPNVGVGALAFNAQLVKDGNPIKAGNFKAMTTFSMTYY